MEPIHWRVKLIRFSNNLIGILNFLTLLLSIPILVMGVWLHKQSTTECERFLEKPIIALGVFLLVVSLMGLIGACCRVSWLLWFYLLVMFLLIVLLFAFTIFAFVVTNKGAGEALSNRGYKEYRLGDYSNWLQNKVTNGNTWERIRGCLESGKLCSEYHFKFLNDNIEKFHAEQLSALQKK
ncbi:tetraspanin-8-like [Lathyrus oleraceus]|uniref:tetraspanin-8-like n=1 Tax=Pisum sativum TaxID=3888 RepID=UPI0021D0732F|nr:tetraspanin-8-like [Pisum sativum]